ncbi:MAG: hypothetical protein WAN54_20720 [Syntrophobacteraceae bacterium]
MFERFIVQFSDNLGALRDFVDLIAPFLAEKHSEEIKEDAINLAPIFVLGLNRLDPEMFELDDHVKSRVTKHFGEISISENLGPEETSITIDFPDSEHEKNLERALKRLSRSYKRKGFLYQSSLISLVSFAEWFLSQLLHQHFDRFPDMIGTHDKAFSLNDLKLIGSIDDARNQIIESEVEGILRGSFSDWLVFLKSQLKLSMSYLSSEKDQITEVFQRRNVLIHNAGILNAIYMANVPEELRTGLTKGMSIRVTKSYLNDAICLFEKYFILIAAELWKQYDPKEQSRGEVLNKIAHEHLRQERWSIAESLSYFVMNDKQLPEIRQLLGKINYWQSLKWQGRFDEVRPEIEKIDFSAKDELFEAFRFALLDQEENFFPLSDNLVKIGKLTTSNLEEWPIFREIRKTTIYTQKYSEGIQAALTIEKVDEQP